MSKGTIAVIGGGNGAFAAAAHLTSIGLKVNLCDPYKDGEFLFPIMEDKIINHTGNLLGDGHVVLNGVTSSLEEATKGVELVIICAPTSTHSYMAEKLAQVLEKDTAVLLDPGHTGGALNFLNSIRKAGYSDDLILGETNTLTYVARKSDPKTVNVSHYAKNIFISSLPGKNLEKLLKKTRMCFPDLRPQSTVIGTSLRNLNAMMHPPGMILAAVWIEKEGGNWTFYYDGATDSVENVMQVIDDERLSIAEAWGSSIEPFIDLLADIGTTSREAQKTRSLKIAFLESHVNRYIKSPTSLDDRYMHEDFGYGIVPMIELAQLAGFKAQMMEALTTIASTIMKIDYRVQGLNKEKMGLAGMSFDDLKDYLTEGR